MTKVCAVYFSPTGHTEKVVIEAASAAAKALGIGGLQLIDLAKPAARERKLRFGPKDLVFIGTPTYAGRVPNKIMPYIRDEIKGSGAAGAVIVTYGNRSFDDSLMELNLLMQDDGFKVIGGGAFVSQHAFAEKLAAGRPGEEDFSKAAELGRVIGEKYLSGDFTQPEFPGNNPVGPYYIPKGTDGKPAVFLKAKPVTDVYKCDNCGLCAARCPMGSIDFADCTQVNGICIKCQACIKICPMGAKAFDDEAFLSHKAMLEENFADSENSSVIYI